VVFEPGRVLHVLPLLDDPRGLEAPQAIREDVARRAGVPHDRPEAVHAEGQLADDEQRPFLTDDGECGFDGTRARDDGRSVPDVS